MLTFWGWSWLRLEYLNSHLELKWINECVISLHPHIEVIMWVYMLLFVEGKYMQCHAITLKPRL